MANQAITRHRLRVRPGTLIRRLLPLPSKLQLDVPNPVKKVTTMSNGTGEFGSGLLNFYTE